MRHSMRNYSRQKALNRQNCSPNAMSKEHLRSLQWTSEISRFACDGAPAQTPGRELICFSNVYLFKRPKLLCLQKRTEGKNSSHTHTQRKSFAETGSKEPQEGRRRSQSHTKATRRHRSIQVCSGTCTCASSLARAHRECATTFQANRIQFNLIVGSFHVLSLHCQMPRMKMALRETVQRTTREMISMRQDPGLIGSQSPQTLNLPARRHNLLLVWCRPAPKSEILSQRFACLTHSKMKSARSGRRLIGLWIQFDIKGHPDNTPLDH